MHPAIHEVCCCVHLIAAHWAAQSEQTTWQHGVTAADTSVTRFMHIGQLCSAIATANLTKMLKERVHMRLLLLLIYVVSYFIKA
jgi:hypothetical protein